MKSESVNKTCIVCNKPFESYAKPGCGGRGAEFKARRPVNAITHSKACAIIYKNNPKLYRRKQNEANYNRKSSKND